MPDTKSYSLEYMKGLPGKSMYDDLFFSAVCEDKDSVAELLRPVMANPGLEIIDVRPQATKPNLMGHSGRLDVTAVDKNDGTLYDIEMQQRSAADMVNRVRFYAALMEMEAFKRGRDGYKKAVNTVIVVFSKNDPFKGNIVADGREIYPIGRCFLDTKQRFEDGAKIIFFNGENKRDTDLGRLAHDLLCTDAKMIYNVALRSRVEFLKHNPGGIKIMQRYADQFWNDAWNEAYKAAEKKFMAEGREEGMVEGQKKMAINLLALGVSAHDIARSTNFSLAEVEKMRDESQANRVMQ